MGVLSDLLPPALALVALALVGYWLVVVTEGAYLGKGAVRFLYDRGAPTYDGVKNLDHLDEFMFLGRPLLDRLEETAGPRALVLDIATGTARLPVALTALPFFEGQIVGVDNSIGMLVEAVRKSEAHADRTHLVAHDAAPLPFADGTFDAVTLLEALEFFPDRDAALAESVRVLAPGGCLIVTNRVGIDLYLMPGRTDVPARFEAKLAALGLTDIVTHKWQTYYDLVWASKPGVAERHDECRPWQHALLCKACGAAGRWAADDGALTCQSCGHVVAGRDRIWYP